MPEAAAAPGVSFAMPVLSPADVEAGKWCDELADLEEFYHGTDKDAKKKAL